MLILILPGPTILTILSHTLTGGRRVIWAAVAAVACGDLISMSLALIGLGALLAASALAFTALKWLVFDLARYKHAAHGVQIRL